MKKSYRSQGPNLDFERLLWKKGYKKIAGADEVGRGCFAGPVVAAVVAFGKNTQNKILNAEVKIDDSKKLSKKQRDKSYFWIRKEALFYGIGKAGVALINKDGIKKATETAFRRAIINTGKRPDYLLIDAFFIPYIKGIRRKNQMPIIHGDTKSMSIAAASILAKVYRDRLMAELGSDPRYKRYAWEENKGYGTKKHQKSIKKYGITKHHRKQFVETWFKKLKS